MKRFLICLIVFGMMGGYAFASEQVIRGDLTVQGTLTAETAITNDGDLTVKGGDLAVGVAATEPGDIVLHDAGTITMYDDGNDTSIIMGPVTNGGTILGITGSLDVSGSVDARTSVITPAITAPAASLVIKPTTDAVNAVQVQDKDGNAIGNFDTVNNRFGVGTAAPTYDVEIKSHDSTAFSIIGKDATTTPVVTMGECVDKSGSICCKLTNSTKARLQAKGDSFVENNFGIGTGAPEGLLEVSQVTTGLGTVSVNDVNVVGTNTQFLNTFKVGDTITANGETRTIATIADDTHMTTTLAWTTTTNKAYTLVGGSRMAVLGNGYVGVGTTTPTTNLDVVGTAKASVGVNTPAITAPAASLVIKPTTDAVNAVQVQDKDGNNILNVDTTNNRVGIGTAAPGAKLQVDGTQIRFADPGATTSDNYSYLNTTAASYNTQKLTIGTTYGNQTPIDALTIYNGSVGIGTTDPDTRFHAEIDDATTNATTNVQTLTHTTSGTPAANIGAGLAFEVETAAANNEIIATVEGVATTVTGAAEQGALVFKTMNTGAAASAALRIQNKTLVYANETVTCVTEAGTASPLTTLSLIVTDGDADTDEDTVSLADGILTGQLKIFVYKTETDAGDSANVTPAHPSGFAKILFDTPGEGCTMIWDGAGWAIVSNNGGTLS